MPSVRDVSHDTRSHCSRTAAAEVYEAHTAQRSNVNAFCLNGPPCPSPNTLGDRAEPAAARRSACSDRRLLVHALQLADGSERRALNARPRPSDSDAGRRLPLSMSRERATRREKLDAPTVESA